jgi:predicted O-methyltransferase YrrM
MTVPELLWLSETAAKYKQIVELGSFKGRSTVVMAKSTSGKVWAVDDWKGPRQTAKAVDGHWVEYNEDHTNLFNEFRENVSELSNVEAVVSDHAAAIVPITPDMVFVDGDHEYESVKRDILTWKARLPKGGLLCGHDRNWPGVEQAIRELLPEWKPAPGTLWSCEL